MFTHEPWTATNSAGYSTPVGIAVDPVVFTLIDNRLHVLLIQRIEDPQEGFLALPGGFQGDAENADETVVRKLQEKTGVAHVYMEPLTFHSEMGRDPRGWMPSLSYLALVQASQLPQERPEGDARWVPINELPELAFDHAVIVEEGIQRMRERSNDLSWFAERACSVLGDEFTLGDAWVLYGQLSGRQLSPSNYANFRRDIVRTGKIEPIGSSRTGGAGRPAELFRRVV